MSKPLHIRISRTIRGYLRNKSLSKYGVGYLADTPQGVFAVDPGDYLITRSLLRRGGYHKASLRTLLALVDKDSFICFVGTHIGTLLVPIAKKAGRVVGFEANPNNFRFLAYNINLNGISNATVRNLAVCDRNGAEVLVRHDALNTGHSHIVPDTEAPLRKGTFRVPTISLDSELGAEVHIDLVVIDIEGAEVHALRGMQNIMGRVKYLFAEFCPQLLSAYGESPQSFIGVLARHFSHMYVCGDSPQAFEDGSWQAFLHDEPARNKDLLLNLLFSNQPVPFQTLTHPS